MDPNACLARWVEALNEGDSREAYHARMDFNAWINRGGGPAIVQVWSNRVFGVPVTMEVTWLGRKLMHGQLSFGASRWSGKVSPGRIVER